MGSKFVKIKVAGGTVSLIELRLCVALPALHMTFSGCRTREALSAGLLPNGVGVCVY